MKKYPLLKNPPYNQAILKIILKLSKLFAKKPNFFCKDN